MADLVMYGTPTCSDCRRSKRFLEERGIAYDYVDLEHDAEATALVVRLNGGRRTVPTIVFADGSFLAEPTDAELAAKLGVS